MDLDQQPDEIVEPLTPNVKQALFLRNVIVPDVGLHLAVGGAGGGKTQGICQLLTDLTVNIPGNEVAVIRKFAKDLKDSVYGEFKATTSSNLIAEEHKQDKDLYLHTVNPRFISRICFRGLDEVDRWGSKQFGHIIMDEAHECELRDLIYLRTRLRHKINKAVDLSQSPYAVYRPTVEFADECAATGANPMDYLDDPRCKDGFEWRIMRFIVIAFNPPRNQEHWAYPLWLNGELAGKKVKTTVTHFTTYDNRKNLDPEYIQQMEEGMPEAEYQRMVMGEPSAGIDGTPCTPDYDDKECVFDGPLPSTPVIVYRGLDPGWHHPAMAWLTYNRDDQTADIWAVDFGTDVDIWKFMKQVLETESRFHPDILIYDEIDPYHADQHSDKSERTTRQILREDFGVKAKSQASGPRERADLLNKLFRQRRLRVHTTLKILRNGFRGGWHKDKHGEDPEKDGFYEHVMDALGYIVWRLFAKKKRIDRQGNEIYKEPRPQERLYQMKGPPEKKRQLITPGMGRRQR